jgi:NCS1 family nucleobase:cation symporter-1
MGVAPLIDRSTAGRAEAPLTLAEPAPRVLGWFDQIGLWGNLGMSILGPVTAIYILQPSGLPRMSFVGAAVAILIGTVLGTLLIGAAAVPGAQTGAPTCRRSSTWCNSSAGRSTRSR